MHPIPDDQLRLIFTCCHPALAPESRGRADAAHARRPDDARDRPRLPRPRADARPAPRPGQEEDPRRRHPVRVPPADRLPERLDGRAARPLPRLQRGLRRDRGRGAGPARAVRRGDPAGPRRSPTLMPDEPEALGPAGADAAARRPREPARDGRGRRARAARGPGPRRAGTRRGSPRARRWSSGRSGMRPGRARTSSRRRSRPSTTRRRRADETDWAQILGLYEVLARIAPSPVVALNRAVALAQVAGPETGLAAVDALGGDPAMPTTCSSTRPAPTSCGGWSAGTRRSTPTGGPWS